MAFNQNVELVGPYQSCAPGAAGSSSFAFTAPAAGNYAIDWKLMLPRVVSGGGQSGAIVKITNATGPVTIYLSNAGEDGGHVDFVAAASDVITFNLSSATAADIAGLNVVKATIAITSGV
jgi:hypothetical protein